ncbi:HPr family phosphocarrier protein [Pradoshia sp.]
MVEKQVTVHLKTGLQARPAAQFVQKASSFSSEIYIMNGDKKVNVKSIMGLMSLAVSSGSVITLVAEGSDEEQAIRSLEEFLKKD